MNDTVECLIKKVKQGDQLAFSELIESYQHEVYRICFRLIGNRHEAEEMPKKPFCERIRTLTVMIAIKNFLPGCSELSQI